MRLNDGYGLQRALLRQQTINDSTALWHPVESRQESSEERKQEYETKDGEKKVEKQRLRERERGKKDDEREYDTLVKRVRRYRNRKGGEMKNGRRQRR